LCGGNWSNACLFVCFGATFDTNVTWYPTENYTVVLIIQVIIVKEDILSYGVTEIFVDN